MTDDDPEEGGVVTPKRLGARKQGTVKSSLRHSALSSEQLPTRPSTEEDRPSYNQEYLQELRNSTPSTPKNVSIPTSDEEKDKVLDISGKFGDMVQISAQTAIPSEAEIREKKERRARLAHEEEYISLDQDEDEEWTLSRKGEEKVESRLVPDDEDFAEGFDEFVEDGAISLGKRAEREQRRRNRTEMKGLIDEAEGVSEEDDSETERRAAYEAAQTRAGMEGLPKNQSKQPSRPKTPPKITPIPSLASTLARLRLSLHTMENSKLQSVQRLEELRNEKVEISNREEEIQRLLKEAGDNYEKLRAEAGLNLDTPNLLTGPEVQGQRGLESLATATAPTGTESPQE